MAKILCLDWDGVIHSYTSGWKGATVIPDPPVVGAVEFILAAVKVFQVAIYSSRSSEPGGIHAMKWALGHWIIESELMDMNLVWGFVEGGIMWPTSKPSAFLTIDDRAIRFEGSWPDVVELTNFRTWQGR